MEILNYNAFTVDWQLLRTGEAILKSASVLLLMIMTIISIITTLQLPLSGAKKQWQVQRLYQQCTHKKIDTHYLPTSRNTHNSLGEKNYTLIPSNTKKKLTKTLPAYQEKNMEKTTNYSMLSTAAIKRKHAQLPTALNATATNQIF